MVEVDRTRSLPPYPPPNRVLTGIGSPDVDSQPARHPDDIACPFSVGSRPHSCGLPRYKWKYAASSSHRSRNRGSSSQRNGNVFWIVVDISLWRADIFSNPCRSRRPKFHLGHAAGHSEHGFFSWFRFAEIVCV